MRLTFLYVFLSFAFGIGSVGAGELRGLAPDELQSLAAAGALVVDVRTPEEWKSTGVIPGSVGLTYFDAAGAYDHAAWLKRLQALRRSPDQPVALVCRSGHRSATVGKALAAEAGIAKVYHLEKGIRGWSGENRPLTPCAAPPAASAAHCMASAAVSR